MHVDGLLSANLCLITLLSSEQCSQFEIFRLQNVQMVNKASSFNTTFIGNNRTELTTILVVVELVPVLDNRLPVKITAQPILGRGADTLHLTYLTRPQFHYAIRTRYANCAAFREIGIYTVQMMLYTGYRAVGEPLPVAQGII